MKDFKLKVCRGSNGTYIMLKHEKCSQILGYPKNLADAMIIFLGHECESEK